MIGKHVLLAAVLVSTAFFIGCSMGSDDDDSDDDSLKVSLSIMDTSYAEASSFYSYQPFYAIATVTNNISTVDYTWYVNGDHQTSVSSSDDSVRFIIPTSFDRTFTIAVSVKDYNDDQTSAKKDVTIKAASALLIENYSDYSITSLKYKTAAMSSLQEILSGSISPDYSYIRYGIPAGTYSFQAVNSIGTTYTKENENFSLGGLCEWVIYNGTSSFANRTGTVSGTDILSDKDTGILMYPASKKIQAEAFPVQK